MGFPKNSAFDRGEHESVQEFAARLDAKHDFPVRHVGQANIVEIPVKVLEEWIAEIEFIAGDMRDASDQVQLDSILDDMRSYFRG